MFPTKTELLSIFPQATTYGELLRARYLAPLNKAANISRELQEAVLKSLHWYFTIDRKERAPTVVVDEAMADQFHEIVARIMAHIDVETIASFDAHEICPEVRQALLSYKVTKGHSAVSINAIDHDQGLVQVTYFVHGDPPTERFFLDGREARPVFEKYRACTYFRRRLLRERIAWLPATTEKSLNIQLNGKPALITLGMQSFVAADISVAESRNKKLLEARLAFPPDNLRRQRLPLNRSGIKGRLLLWLACLQPFKRRYQQAWILIDRESDSDDNAEELYRWIRKHRPEINVWFLLAPNSADWKRLKKEGFRLVPPGLKRKILLVNAENIISSHVEYSKGILSRNYLGSILTCKYSFVPHGISKDDVSHWLNPQCYDYIATASPAEYRSFIDNDTPYSYTKKEVHLTGFPRQDRIDEISSQMSQDEVRKLLVMPTWRAALVDARSKMSRDSRDQVFNCEYMSRWREFLNSDALRELAEQSGIRVVFMLHHNARPFLYAFSPPRHVEVIDCFSKKIMCESVALVTDYTSVAFEMARLRRPTFYYQFDREAFYGGSHNWRKGYFDYERDGFGPVATTQEALLVHIREFLENAGRSSEKLLSRMREAMPFVDGFSCARVFSGIANLRKPLAVSHGVGSEPKNNTAN